MSQSQYITRLWIVGVLLIIFLVFFIVKMNIHTHLLLLRKVQRESSFLTTLIFTLASILRNNLPSYATNKSPKPHQDSFSKCSANETITLWSFFKNYNIGISPIVVAFYYRDFHDATIRLLLFSLAMALLRHNCHLHPFHL